MNSRRPKQPLPNIQVKLQNYITTSCGISSQWSALCKGSLTPAWHTPTRARKLTGQQDVWRVTVSTEESLFHRSIFQLSHCLPQFNSTAAASGEHRAALTLSEHSLLPFSIHLCSSSIFEAGSPLKSYLNLSAFEAMGQQKDDQCFPVYFHQQIL